MSHTHEFSSSTHMDLKLAGAKEKKKKKKFTKKHPSILRPIYNSHIHMCDGVLCLLLQHKPSTQLLHNCFLQFLNFMMKKFISSVFF